MSEGASIFYKNIQERGTHAPAVHSMDLPVWDKLNVLSSNLVGSFHTLDYKHPDYFVQLWMSSYSGFLPRTSYKESPQSEK